MEPFTSAEDRDEVLNGGPLIVNGAILALEPFTHDLISSPHRLPRTTLWLRLPNLPPVCWNSAALELMLASTGQFIRMESMISKGRFTRVVEIDVSKPLAPGTDVKLEGLKLPVF